MKTIWYFIRCMSVSFLIFSTHACQKETIQPQDTESPVDYRSFYMGFTGFPYDLTSAALQKTYKDVNEHGDIYLNHLDHGVPWQEALVGAPFPNEVQTTLYEAVEARRPGNKFFLSATATSQERNKIANYWNDHGTHQPLSGHWMDMPFDDPMVIKAYLNYCRRIIDFSDPDYFAYGIEINASFRENSRAFKAYLTFADTVYHTLKNEYPNLPIMLTFQDQSFVNSRNELMELTSRLLPYTDYIAMSTYPFWQYDYPKRDADPTLFAVDWLKDFRALDPNKPFAISETGYNAEDLVIDNFGVRIRGTEEWQKEYVLKLLRQAEELKASFVCWFVFRDYDLLYDKYYSQDDLTKIWRDNGLIDGLGHERPAFQVWKNWKKLAKQ